MLLQKFLFLRLMKSIVHLYFHHSNLLEPRVWVLKKYSSMLSGFLKASALESLSKANCNYFPSTK